MPAGPDAALRALAHRYLVQRVLGRGSQATVYAAHDRELNRDIALKVASSGSLSGTRLERFQREGEVTAGLDHPGIVKVHSMGVAAGVPYLAYEQIPGARTLTDAFKSERDLARRVRMVRDMAEALGYAHEHGVTHRDVKPDNVLVADGRVRVADFGLAAVGGQERLTRTGAVVGTPHYMAPEQVLAARDEVGPWSDVWALGVVLYQALTHDLPFEGETFLSLSRAIAEADFEPPRAFNPEVPAELEAVCLQAMALAPRDRYPHGGAMAADLDAWIEGRPVSASKSGSSLRQLSRGLRRRRRMFLGAVPMGAGLAAVILAWTWGAGPATPPPPEPPAREPVARAAVPEPAPAARDPQAELRAMRREADPAVRLAAAEAWLESFADHVSADEVRELARTTRRSFPLGILQHAEQPTNVGAWFTPDGRVVSWGEDGRVVLWTLSSPQSEHEPRPVAEWRSPRGAVLSAALAPSGAWAVVGARDGAWQIDLNAAAAPTLVPIEEAVSAVCVSPDGASVLVGCFSGRVTLHAWPGWELLTALPGHDSAVRAVAFSPDGALAVTASGNRLDQSGAAPDNTMRIWSLPDAELVHVSEVSYAPNCVVFLPQGDRFLLGTSGGYLFVHDFEGRPLSELVSEDARTDTFTRPAGHSGGVLDAAIAPGTRRLYSVSGQRGDPWGNELRVWDLDTEALLWAVADRPRTCRTVDVSPDGGTLVVGTGGGTVELWAPD
jgi:Protein kinase domain/WD domain, G-beta repeat